jgi:CDP-paratose 2-epimerase
MSGTPYTVFGYKGKQVRDNIHSADLVRAMEAFWRCPRPAEVYNMGGGRDSNCSMLEAIAIRERISGRPLAWRYEEQCRVGDHMWYISDLTRFRSHFPDWRLEHDIESICTEIFENNRERWQWERANAG